MNWWDEIRPSLKAPRRKTVNVELPNGQVGQYTIEMDDMNAKWWDGIGPIDVTQGGFPTGWARTAITWAAIKGGPPLIQVNRSASLIEKDEEVVTKDGGVELFQGLIDAFLQSLPEFRQIWKSTSNKDSYWEAGNERQTTCFATGGSLVEIEFNGDRQLSLEMYSQSNEEVAQVVKFWQSHTTQAQPRGRVHVLVQTAEGPEFRSIGVGAEKLERANYSDEVLAGYDRMVKDLQATNPHGRVAIMNGKPGTGKTYLVRGLLNDVRNAIMIVVPSNLVAELAQPSMMLSLIELHAERQRPLIFIIEDADECLAPRMGDNISAVSNMLNMGDGLLGKILDIRIVCTTNAKRQELDKAIIRPGRLSTEIEVGPLNHAKTREVYKRLTGTDREDLGSKTLAEIYQVARDAGWKPVVAENAIGF